MDPQRWARLKGLFEAAVDLSAGERAAAVAAARAEDPQLADELAALLAHDPEPTIALPSALVADGSPNGADATTTSTVPLAPDRIDRYRILEEIGHGGMGRVFLAERADGAFRQRLAIKVLHAGVWAGEDVRRRFVAERQILARLTHPAIARLIDGGTAATGEPYLAMEYVEGKPIDDYCRDAALDVDAVLRLVLRVCAAVESAHRSLVVHRDLKPSNILVMADGQPKLLDFGIAKLLDPELADEAAVHTRHGHAPLTPRYAAPEQVRGEPVTVATDVYSLGVVLYELLTGESPYRVTSHDPLSFARAVVEQEPAPPSTAASRTGVTHPTQPAGVSTVTRPLGRRLSADLDAIVLKALRKEPERRYGSMAELAADIARYLDGLPVEARRGSRLYRFGKLLRRRALPLAAGAAFVALVVAFGVDRQLQLRETAAERDRAQRVTEFLVDLFEQSDPSEARGNTITVREALDRGAARIDRELQAQPATRATLLDAVGRVYHNLGLYDRSGALLDRAATLRRRHGTREELAETLFNLARSQHVAGDLTGAAKTYQESAALSRATGDKKQEAQATSELAQVRLDDGGYEEAVRLFTRAAELRRAAGKVEPLDLAEDLTGLSIARQNSGDPTGAKSVIAEADALLRLAKDPEPLRTAMIEGELALSERGLGDVPAATVRLERAIARLHAVLPGDHGELANLYNTQAMLRADAGNLAGSIAAFEQSGAMWRRLVGEEHPRTALATSNLGVLYLRRGEWRKAEELIGRGLATSRKTLPPGHPDLAIDLENLADAKLELGELDEAARLLAESAAIVTAGEKPSERALGRLHGRQARHLERRGELERAEELARRSLLEYEATVAAESPLLPSAKLIVGRVLLARGRAAEALPLVEAAVDARRKSMGEAHYETAAAKSLLAQALLETGDAARAQALLEEALPVQRAALAPWHFALAETRERLARAMLARGNRDGARAMLAEAINELRGGFQNGHPFLPQLERELAGIAPNPAR